MSVPRKTPVPLKKVANRDIYFLQKETGRKGVTMATIFRCHFVSFVMYIFGAKCEDHCSNISGDILNLVFYRFIGTIYDVITFLICIIQKRELISYLLRFSDTINRMKNSYGNFFIQSQSRIDFLTRGKSRFVQSEISCQNESVSSQTRSRF